MRPVVARALFALMGIGSVRPNHGAVQCEKCKRMTPALDPNGSYVCTCGGACYVDGPRPGDASGGPPR